MLKRRAFLLVAILIFLQSTALALPVGKAAPSFSLRDLEGNNYYLSDYVGKTPKYMVKGLIISFFASYCKPCKTELPILNRLTDEFRKNGIEVLILSYQEDADVIAPLLEQLHVDKPLVLCDRYGAVGKKYEVRTLPMTFFINHDGKVVDVIRGALDDLENVLRKKAKLLLTNQ